MNNKLIMDILNSMTNLFEVMKYLILSKELTTLALNFLIEVASISILKYDAQQLTICFVEVNHLYNVRMIKCNLNFDFLQNFISLIGIQASHVDLFLCKFLFVCISDYIINKAICSPAK